MRIFYWTPYFSNVGTIKATVNSAVGMSRLGHEVYLIKAYREWEGQEQILKKENIGIIDLKNMQNVSLPRSGFGVRITMLMIALLSFFKLIKLFKNEKPDVVISSLMAVPAILAHICSGSRNKRKFAASIQGMPKFLKNFKLSANYPLWMLFEDRFRKFLWKILYKKADVIIAISEPTYVLLGNEFAFMKNRLHYIPNPIIDDEIFAMANESPEDIFKRDNRFTIVKVGRLTYQKDTSTLIRAAGILKNRGFDCNLVLLGSGEEWDMLHSLTNELNLEDSVVFMGHQSNPYKFMRVSDVFVLSSLWEDMTHVLVEAAALRIPIVSTKCPNGQEEFLGFGKGGILCEVADPYSMADALYSAFEMIKTGTFASMTEYSYEKSKTYTIEPHSKSLEVCLNTFDK